MHACYMSSHCLLALREGLIQSDVSLCFRRGVRSGEGPAVDPLFIRTVQIYPGLRHASALHQSQARPSGWSGVLRGCVYNPDRKHRHRLFSIIQGYV